jgi:hypothetical protein
VLVLLLLLYPKNDPNACRCCCHVWGCAVKTAAAATASRHTAVPPAKRDSLDRLQQIA